MGATKSVLGRILRVDNKTGYIFRQGNRGVGSSPVSTVIASEYGSDVVHLTVLTCTAVAISVSDDANVAQYGGVKVYDFPEGLIVSMGAIVSGSLTGYASLIDTFGSSVALGTVTATTGATLVTTEATWMKSVANAAAVAEVAAVDAVSVATIVTESGGSWVDGTGTPADMFLNFVITDDNAHGAGTAYFTGTIKFGWMLLGDN